MKQFRFIGDPNDWYWKPDLIKDKVYDADYSGYKYEGIPVTIEQAATDSGKGCEDWEEVTND